MNLHEIIGTDIMGWATGDRCTSSAPRHPQRYASSHHPCFPETMYCECAHCYDETSARHYMRNKTPEEDVEYPGWDVCIACNKEEHPTPPPDFI